MKHFSLKDTLLLALPLMLFSYGCSQCQRDGSENQTARDIMQSVTIDEQLLADFNKSKLIFYSLPSPLETAMLIKRAGAAFNPDLLNDVNAASRYDTNARMALNLGIYSADMSYSSLFDQTQSTLNFMGAARQLAERLGVMEAIDEGTIRRLEENMNNREVVMDIISETFMNSNAYLTEQDRPAIAVMVLLGGWVEGLYLATQLTEGELEGNPELIDRIVYQKLSLLTLINLMETHSSNEDIARLLVDMQALMAIYDEVKIITTADVEAETHPEERMTILRSQAETFISQETLNKLVSHVAALRAGFVS